MIERAEMGRNYFKIDGTVDSKQKLIDFFAANGFEILDVTDVRNINVRSKDGLEFKVIWFINLCHVSIGKWGEVVLESTFDEIMGSYGPWVDHNVFDFFYEGNVTIKLAIGRTPKEATL